MNFQIREIQSKDNAAVEQVIRACLMEFGANHAGTAWADPDLGRFSQVYSAPGSRYWVAENQDGDIVGGVGIGPLEGLEDVCELQKMYCLPEARGTGVAGQLMELALEFARRHYRRCYLETLDNMTAAQRFYRRYGFERVEQPLLDTGHFACEVRMIRSL